MIADLSYPGVKSAIDVTRSRTLYIQCRRGEGDPTTAVVEAKRALAATANTPAVSLPTKTTLTLDGSAITEIDVTDVAWIHLDATTAQSGVRVDIEWWVTGSVVGSVVSQQITLDANGTRARFGAQGVAFASACIAPHNTVTTATVDVRRSFGDGFPVIAMSPPTPIPVDNTEFTDFLAGSASVIHIVCTDPQSGLGATLYLYTRQEVEQDMVSKDFRIEVAAGRVPGHSVNRKFGRNDDIDTGSTPEDIWGGGGLYTGIPDTAETIEVFSDDANDTAAGSGARTLQLSGLDADWNEIEETVTLNGTTPVTTSNTWLRCNRQRVITAGSSDSNEGTITLRHTTTTANVFSQIQPGRSQSTILHYTVPAGKKLLLSDIDVVVERTSGSGATASFQLKIRDNANGGVVRSILFGSAERGSRYTSSSTFGEAVSEKNDVWIQIVTVSSNNTSVSGDIGFMLVPA